LGGGGGFGGWGGVVGGGGGGGGGRGGVGCEVFTRGYKMQYFETGFLLMIVLSGGWSRPYPSFRLTTSSNSPFS